MDRREEISLPGSAPYYMQQRGMPTQGSFGVRSITSMLNVPYQSNIGDDSSERQWSGAHGSFAPVPGPPEPQSAIPPHGVNVGEVAKRKRGRPRKYGPEGGGGVSLALTPAPSVGSNPTGKRGRGRPPGTGRKQQLASMGDWLSGSAGTSFTPHVITIAGGEDIATKVMSFSQLSSRAVCVLSASGAVSTVTLRQPSTSGGSVTYEGRFEILSLSGSYLPSDNGGRTGGLSVSLGSPDGRVVGGGVGGLLIAASLVQVIVGSFTWGNSKTKKNKARVEDAGELERLTAGNNPSVVPDNVSVHQGFSESPSVVVWPGSQSMDMHNANIGIDLMRE